MTIARAARRAAHFAGAAATWAPGGPPFVHHDADLDQHFYNMPKEKLAATWPMSVSASSPAPSNTSNDGFIWDVQEILAERTSVSGENEVLVVWKTSWIPVSNLIADGPVLQQFQCTPKIVFSTCYTRTGSMSVYVPVEPGTQLQADFVEIARRRAAAEAAHAEAARTELASDRTPRKALGGVAKRKTTGKDHRF